MICSHNLQFIEMLERFVKSSAEWRETTVKNFNTSVLLMLIVSVNTEVYLILSLAWTFSNKCPSSGHYCGSVYMTTEFHHTFNTIPKSSEPAAKSKIPFRL